MGRVASLDFGLARIGVAVSDENKIIVAAHFVISCEKSSVETVKKVLKSLSQYNPETIVVGLPLHLNGNKGFLADEATHFTSLLKANTQSNVLQFDERFTTKQAERSLQEGNFTRKKRATLIDGISASLLLQNYLDLLSIKEKREHLGDQ